MKLINLIDEIQIGIKLNYGADEGIYKSERLYKDLIFIHKNEELNVGMNLRDYHFYNSRKVPLKPLCEIEGDFLLFNYKGHDDLYELIGFSNSLQLESHIIENIGTNISGFTVFTIPIVCGVAKALSITYQNRETGQTENLDLQRILKDIFRQPNEETHFDYLIDETLIQNLKLELK